MIHKKHSGASASEREHIPWECRLPAGISLRVLVWCTGFKLRDRSFAQPVGEPFRSCPGRFKWHMGQPRCSAAGTCHSKSRNCQPWHLCSRPPDASRRIDLHTAHPVCIALSWIGCVRWRVKLTHGIQTFTTLRVVVGATVQVEKLWSMDHPCTSTARLQPTLQPPNGARKPSVPP